MLANILGFDGHMIFVATTQLCYYSSKAAIDSVKELGMTMFQ